MRPLARGLVADPARVACASGDLAVETHGELCGDKGPPGRYMLEERPDELARFVFAQATARDDSGGLELRMGLPVHQWIGIHDRIVHLGDAGGDDRVDAGRR